MISSSWCCTVPHGVDDEDVKVQGLPSDLRALPDLPLSVSTRAFPDRSLEETSPLNQLRAFPVLEVGSSRPRHASKGRQK